MNKKLIRLLCLAIILPGLVLAPAAGAQTTVEVLPLKYRKSEQVIPVLQSLLRGDSSVTGFQNQLVIRATPAELAQLKRVLADIDTAPKRLLITVRQGADLDRDRRETGLSGSIGNDSTRVTIPGNGSRSGGNVVFRDGDDRLRARIVDTQQSSNSSTSQSIQVLEGSSAFIRVGESRPVRNRQVVRTVVNGQIVDRVVEGTEYRDATTGFSVVPRVQGNIVTLDIDPQRETFDDGRRGSVNVQRVATTVSGRLGEWMDLGGVNESRSDSQSVLLGRSSISSSERRGVQVKVEELP
jgi:type II secretory pathway component GspD/PulD (secretin)